MGVSNMQLDQVAKRLWRKDQMVQKISAGEDLTSRGVADEFGIGVATAQRYLQELVDDGLAVRVRPSPKAPSLWTKPDAGAATVEELNDMEDPPLRRTPRKPTHPPHDLTKNAIPYLLGIVTG